MGFWSVVNKAKHSVWHAAAVVTGGATRPGGAIHQATHKVVLPVAASIVGAVNPVAGMAINAVNTLTDSAEGQGAAADEGNVVDSVVDVYMDAQGNTITKEEYERQMKAIQEGQSTAKPPIATSVSAFQGVNKDGTYYTAPWKRTYVPITEKLKETLKG